MSGVHFLPRRKEGGEYKVGNYKLTSRAATLRITTEYNQWSLVVYSHTAPGCHVAISVYYIGTLK